MSKIDEFKTFVKKHPKLITYVKDGKTTWQKFYELYDLYGENEDAWSSYLTPTVITGGLAVTDIFNAIKNINLDEFQNGINNIQKVLGMLGDLTNKDTKETYKPRPIYKHFED